MTLFLGGDVMTGRGIDQALPHPGRPRLHEPAVRSARTYLELAEARNGPIRIPLDPGYIWGDLLSELERVAPSARIVNLETSVTTSDERWLDKSIHYRMHPANLACLTVAGIDCCTLANNHVLDWGRQGLDQTLDSLHAAGIATAGAGRTDTEAAAPAVLSPTGDRRVLVFGVGVGSSGVPPEWSATRDRSGVCRVEEITEAAARLLAARIAVGRQPGDLVVASIHWGPNWGYGLSDAEQRFAHRLIDEGGVDVVHGHSSHHPRGIEIYRNRPILYGAGDLINDYEGITGHERYRGDLGVAYFPHLSLLGDGLESFELLPLRRRRFRLERASDRDRDWLQETLGRESAELGVQVETTGAGWLRLCWDG